MIDFIHKERWEKVFLHDKSVDISKAYDRAVMYEEEEAEFDSTKECLFVVGLLPHDKGWRLGTIYRQLTEIKANFKPGDTVFANIGTGELTIANVVSYNQENNSYRCKSGSRDLQLYAKDVKMFNSAMIGLHFEDI